MTPEQCALGDLNHSMLALGYGIDNGIEFAIIQNYWGQEWGENGLLRVKLTEDEMGPCGLYLKSSSILL